MVVEAVMMMVMNGETGLGEDGVMGGDDGEDSDVKINHCN